MASIALTMLDTDHIQSLVFSSHKRLPHALACRLTIRDGGSAKAGLRAIIQELSFGLKQPPKTPPRAAQLLLSAGGIRKLAEVNTSTALSRPFQQGMVNPQRSRALGDMGRNDPKNWIWRDDRLDGILLVYSEDAVTARDQTQRIVRMLGTGWQNEGNELIRLPKNGREPFGFRDGISRVRVDIGDGSPPPEGVSMVPPEEVLLDYRPESSSPLARNSAYVVLRDIEQDVDAFWRFWQDQSKTEEEAVWMASKAVGRWPNGMPVTGAEPIPEPPAEEAVIRHSFSFKDDPRGERCPFGAHIRRANPRDGLRADPDLSLRLVSGRRIIRRGRVYGSPASPDAYPASIRPHLESSEPLDKERKPGLLFLALCADLAGQFEFIQQTWLNNPKHADLYDEVDPIAAGDGIPEDHHHFSIPRNPIRRRITGTKKWITVRGGGYFILPSRTALNHLFS